MNDYRTFPSTWSSSWKYPDSSSCIHCLGRCGDIHQWWGRMCQRTNWHTSNDELQKSEWAMNIGQSRIFILITRITQEQMDGGSNKLKLFIVGNAGTWTTFLFNLLKIQVNCCYAKQVVKLGTLTGVATRLANGGTLHSMLKLSVQNDGQIVNMPLLTGNYLRVMRRQWKDIEFLFIDEILMIPYEMTCMIDRV